MKFGTIVLLLSVFVFAQSVFGGITTCDRYQKRIRQLICSLKRCKMNAECPNVEECPALPAPANGSVDISGPQPLGTVATYSCDYVLVSGDLVRYCITGGTWSGTEQTCAPGIARDCTDVYDFSSTSSGVHTVYPCNQTDCPVSVYCDMEIDGGGWTVFQRRVSSTDFFLNWEAYKAGFGNLDDNFWLGLEEISNILSGGSYELKVLLEDFENNTAFADYSSFSVGPESTNYTLSISGYQAGSTAGDSMTDPGDAAGTKNLNGMQFTTKDRDNDLYAANCAIQFSGAWWYNHCHKSNLNGLYLGGTHASNADGVNWESWKGYYYSLKKTVMMFRRT